MDFSIIVIARATMRSSSTRSMRTSVSLGVYDPEIQPKEDFGNPKFAYMGAFLDQNSEICFNNFSTCQFERLQPTARAFMRIKYCDSVNATRGAREMYRKTTRILRAAPTSAGRPMPDRIGPVRSSNSRLEMLVGNAPTASGRRGRAPTGHTPPAMRSSLRAGRTAPRRSR